MNNSTSAPQLHSSSFVKINKLLSYRRVLSVGNSLLMVAVLVYMVHLLIR